MAETLVYIKKRSYVCIRFCCTDWLGNSSIIIENRVSFVLSNGGPRLRVALESRWITKDRSPQILYSRSFVVLFCAAKLFLYQSLPLAGFVCESLIYRRFLTFIFLFCILFVVLLYVLFGRKNPHTITYSWQGSPLFHLRYRFSLDITIVRDNVRDVCFSVA